MASSPIVPPGGQFPIPATLSTPLLAFRCAPAIRPYLPEDVSSPAGIIIDTPITQNDIADASSISLPAHADLTLIPLVVTVSLNGHTLAEGLVPLNASKVELPFSLKSAGLKPQTEAYNLSCTASFSTLTGKTQKFTTSTMLSFLPDPPPGRSVTKMDLRTGALMAKPANGAKGDYETVFPIGFYTSFGDYLATNLSVLNDLKARGHVFHKVHPIPTFDNLTALEEVLDRMEEQGLYLMYDMRWTYMNSTAVTEEVNRIKNRPNLLLWYTGDEPDGTSDPLNATSNAYDLIYSLDGYHPVSLVLNCENYFFTQYTAGTDIVMQDTYMIGNNVTFSSQWGTPCTLDYGDCGCDNCKGVFEDISTRMDEFAQRLWDNGWDRTKAIWAAPQAFGDDTYWKVVPTGQEYVLQSVLAINHGGLGVFGWDDPTTDDIKASATLLAQALLTMKDFILSPAASFNLIIQDRIHVGLWTVGLKTLLLGTNLNNASATFDLADVHGLGGKVTQVLDTGAKLSKGSVVFESVGSGGFVFG
ncbi:hypothetical protein PHLCEN_2v3310 [Hermanssonia centrifuga]|uniref:Uncharacterized protein n=1 Tax=Hermanssonia centrifuga TaxID=98765 RepID=A0A2R6QM83_9APHY|nr:hypothetical protein PHLCEN_2v3310 [Hermanssonia centrifuga]